MATTARDHTTTTTTSGLVKDKRGTSLPNSRPPNNLRKTLSTSSSDRKTTTRFVQPPPTHASSASSSKNVPNYLKSTLASRHEALKHATKPQPVVQRRRSLDKPPSTSSRVTMRSVNSPVTPSRDHHRVVPPARSSSFSPRTTTKPVSRTPTLLKSSQPNSSTKILKKSVSAITTKKEKVASTPKGLKKVSIREVDDKRERVANESHQTLVNSKSDELVNNIDHNHEEHNEQEIVQEEIKTADVLSLVTSEDLNELHHENTYKDIEQDEDANSEHTIDTEFERLHNEIDPEESLVIQDASEKIEATKLDDNEVVKEISSYDNNISEKVHQDNDEGKAKENDNDANKAIDKDATTEGNEVKSPSRRVPSPDVEANNNGGLMFISVKPQGGGNNNKKESPAAYNAVIEETKNKLLEKSKKNKVLALVGAFETVIDYETAANSK
ncbi:hypothetical protein ACFE04_002234 [Oxalis oulophora]